MTSDARRNAAPRFTIVMNVYNGEKWLRESLESAFAQTFRDWELLFWDDQSTDASAAVLAEFPEDPRVRYVYAPERTPLGKARELAIREARGEWLAFLDQDDIWTPDKLEKQARVIDDWRGEALSIVYGRAMKFGTNRAPRDFDRWHEFTPMPQGDIFEALFVDSCFICQSAVCLRAEAARAVGAVPPEYRFCPDYFYYTELASRHQAACTQDVVCWYRVHASAMSRQNYTDVLEEMLAVAERWKHRLDPAVYRRRRAIQQTLLGLREITSGANPARGLGRILRDGSVPYLLSRPFVLLNRGLQRMVLYARTGRPRMPEPGRTCCQPRRT
jgi:glycosyltransferase involved in cell wall biosynthesis